MPTLFRMSDEKQTADSSPTVVIAETSPSAKQRNTKKYVIIGVSAILGAVIILTAILVGMYLFTEAQKDIIKYTLSLGDKSKQDVTSDPNENVVQYHVSSPGQETWIVNDFNKDIQVVKIRTEENTNCYVSALNRSAAMDPSKIAKPDSDDIKGAATLHYVTSDTPISDTSFLSKTATAMCKGISTYWVYPQCLDKPSAAQNGTDMAPKSKRDVIAYPYYYQYYYGGYACVKGCCAYVCACRITYYYYVSGGYIYCTWYTYNCAGYSSGPAYYGCALWPNTCPNRYPQRWSTC